MPFFLQIKYLRVPETLLDSVKEEQNRAREAGRSARGGHVSGGKGGRGGPTRGGIYILSSLRTSHLCPLQVVVDVEHLYAVGVDAGGVCSIIRRCVIQWMRT
jgi:hypothetical protein